jgi:hypothetical protein
MRMMRDSSPELDLLLAVISIDENDLLAEATEFVRSQAPSRPAPITATS